MSPISYQGPMESDETPKHTHSQSTEGNLGLGQPGVTVEAILSTKGDDIYTATPHTALKEVIAELSRLRIGALVVVNSSREPIGIVSERDIVHAAEARESGIFEILVEEIMTKNPVTCHPEDKVEAIMRKMTEGRFRHMPVTDGGKLTGLVSIGDVVRHRMMEIEYENLKMKQAIVG